MSKQGRSSMKQLCIWNNSTFIIKQLTKQWHISLSDLFALYYLRKIKINHTLHLLGAEKKIEANLQHVLINSKPIFERYLFVPCAI